MLFKIAWRNLLRNKRRSLIVLISVIVGVAALLLNDSFYVGMMNQMVDNQIKSHVSHIEIHKKGFNDDKIIQSFLPEPEKINRILSECNFIKHYSKRVITFGLISSAGSSSGIALVGIEPDKEKAITSIHKSLIKGKYFTGGKREILIGKSLAEKLEVGLGDKLVAVAANVDGSVSSDLFRVIGIYQSGASEFDKMHVYIPLAMSQEMLGLGNNFSEFAMLTANPKFTFQYKDTILSQMKKAGITANNYEVMTYQELMPLMMTYVEMYDQMSWIIYIIIAVAILFGIINTMLMSIFERVHEFGVLMSIGMRSSKIFLMVLQEAFVLGMFGTLIGIIIGLAIYIPLHANGLDLSIYSESLSSFGLGSVIYPELNLQVIFNCLFFVPFAAILGAIYPAIKAIKLLPTEAMRYV